MNKKGSVMLLGILILGGVLGFSIGQIYNSKPINIPSQCYTDLQPKPFLSNGQGLLSENHLQNYVQIEIPNREFKTTQSATTGSMHPTISNTADLIEIIPEKEDLGIGDIITFDCNGKSIRHRIIKIENGIYTTKGDNNKSPDNCIVKFEDIKTKIVGVLY
jgi:hypothetical protein